MRSILEVIQESRLAPELPKGLEPAIKFVQPDWTTHGGFAWFQPGKRWIQSPDDSFNPETCVSGGLHVANTIQAAQSGGAKATHCLYVGVKASKSGPWDGGKRKARQVYVAGPVDLIEIIKTSGSEADLSEAYLRGADLKGADLGGANLGGANLGGADLWEAYLWEAYLWGANLGGADLGGANLGGANLWGANLGGANLWGADLGGADLEGANLEGANLEGAYLGGANLWGANLEGATGRPDWDDLVKRGAIR